MKSRNILYCEFIKRKGKNVYKNLQTLKYNYFQIAVVDMTADSKVDIASSEVNN